jgi:hypothetical protein
MTCSQAKRGSTAATTRWSKKGSEFLGPAKTPGQKFKVKYKKDLPRVCRPVSSGAIDTFAPARHVKGAGHDVGSTVTG